MICWVVASHDQAVLAANLQPALDVVEALGDQVVVVRDAPSIAAAYNAGTAAAEHPVRCFVHHDVRVLDVDGLRAGLLRECTSAAGMVGVIGSRTLAWPWWETSDLRCGSVVDTRMGLLDFGAGGHPAALLDGLLLATAKPFTWDEGYQGWHGYDHDACAWMLASGLQNWCLPRGAELVEHHTVGPVSTGGIDGWAAAESRWRLKWEAR